MQLSFARMVTAAAFAAALSGAGTSWAQDKPISIAVNGDPDVLDMTTSTNPPQGLVTLVNVYGGGLLENKPDGTLIPGLAESYDVSEDGKLITMHLRHGVKFQSGDDFTAKDVVWSHERQLAKAPFYRGFARFIDHLDTPDDYTVKFVFKQVDAQFLPVHAIVIASKSYFDRVGEDEFRKHPNGTGPYKFIAYKAAEFLDLEAFDGYWGPKPAVKKAHFVFVQDDNTRVAKLQAGEVDMISDASYTAVDALTKAGFNIEKLPVHPTQSVQFQVANTKTPWANLKVRQAMAYAIDTNAIVSGLLHGVPVHYPRLVPGELGYDANLKDYKYDPAMAKKLLNEAGYANGFKMPLYFSAGVYFGTQETAEAVSLYLKAVGIETKVEGLQLVALLQMIGKMAKDPNGQYVAVAGLPIANLPDPVEGVSLAFYGKSPFSLYHNDALDAVFEQAEAAIEDKKRAPLITKMMEIEQDDLPSITLWQYMNVYVQRKGLAYAPQIHGLSTVNLWNLSMAK